MKKLDNGYFYLIPMLLLATAPAQAYIGPGLGAGTLGVILGLLGSVLIAIFAFFWYPIKRTFKKWTASGDDSLEEDDELEAAEDQR
jgi:hypothetical protein